MPAAEPAASAVAAAMTVLFHPHLMTSILPDIHKTPVGINW